MRTVQPETCTTPSAVMRMSAIVVFAEFVVCPPWGAAARADAGVSVPSFSGGEM